MEIKSKQKTIYPALIVFALVFSLLPTGSLATPQRSRTSASKRQIPVIRTAFDRGYIKGYNDGYLSGKSDYNTRSPRDFQRSSLYQEANRGYEPNYGALEDFQEGFRMGFEIGYTDGYFGRLSNAKIPGNAQTIHRRAIQSQQATQQQPANDSTQGGSALIIPDGTEMKLRLRTQINTKVAKAGDKFTATVIEPSSLELATVEGHLAKLTRSGRMTGRTEMVLDFDTITTKDGKTAPLTAQIEKIYASEHIKTVDDEGHIETADRSRDTQVRTAGGAAIGAILGGIAGGGKGAVIGAVIGAGAGAGSVYAEGNKDIILDEGTEMTLRTYPPRNRKTKQGE